VPATPENHLLERLRQARERAGLFIDFDGTLSDIVARPELAEPAPGALGVLARLTHRFAVVAVVSGRSAEDLHRLLPVPGVEVFGLYGIAEDAPSPSIQAARDEVEAVAQGVKGAWVEDKRVSLAVHYRVAEDVGSAGKTLSDALGRVAERHGLDLLAAKVALELVPSGTPGKGSVIVSEQGRRDLQACLYAGDDMADLSAFVALDELAGRSVLTVKVAVRSAETPDELESRADIVVERPAGLVELLSGL